ncbi:hypothetical protein JCM11491_001420 [Sporobolomyces phaffii]
MLNHLVTTRYTSGSPPLIVLSDSLVQPGRALFHQLVASAPAATRTVLVCAEHAPVRAVPPRLDPARVEVIDCTVDPDFPQPSSSSSASVDLGHARAQQHLEDALARAVAKARTEPGPVQIGIDAINALADELGTPGVWRLIKKGLRALEVGSRLVLVHHDHFPALPGSPSAAPALLASLLSPHLSPATIHLALHPTAQFHTLSTRFSLALPTTALPDDAPDLRTTEFLARVRERGVGDPFRRPERSDEPDERIALDALAHGDGRAVLGWHCRGVTVGGGKVSRVTAAGGGGGGEKKVVTSGFAGLKRKGDDGGFDVEEVELGAVLDPRKMARARDDMTNLTPVTAPDPTSSVAPASAGGARPAPPPPSSSTASAASLPFSLKLTPSQLAARALVANPYAGSDQPIFGEAGYTGRRDEPPARGGGLRVEYTADRGDDLDEEEPDEDLEI